MACRLVLVGNSTKYYIAIIKIDSIQRFEFLSFDPCQILMCQIIFLYRCFTSTCAVCQHIYPINSWRFPFEPIFHSVKIFTIPARLAFYSSCAHLLKELAIIPDFARTVMSWVFRHGGNSDPFGLGINYHRIRKYIMTVFVPEILMCIPFVSAPVQVNCRR